MVGEGDAADDLAADHLQRGEELGRSGDAGEGDDVAASDALGAGRRYEAGADDRVKGGACVGMMSTWRGYLLNKAYTHTWMCYVPLLPKYLDYPEILGMRMPLPTLVQNNAEESVRRVVDLLDDGAFVYEMDDGGAIKVKIAIDKKARQAIIDFTGTSDQRPGNFNAPFAVCRAAVLYVFRTLVDDDIPLNAGCLKPLRVIVPEGSMLNPRYPAAVVAGNVETSQAVVDALYGALGVMAASQGTMNNFTFGNDDYQYYETICGGAGAGPVFDGADAGHTHMANSRITDPGIRE